MWRYCPKRSVARVDSIFIRGTFAICSCRTSSSRRVVWTASRLGVSNTRTLIFASALPFIALTSLTILLVYRLTLRWCEDERAALVAALLFAMHWIPLGFGSTVYPRTLAAACVWGSGADRRSMAVRGRAFDRLWHLAIVSARSCSSRRYDHCHPEPAKRGRRTPHPSAGREGVLRPSSGTSCPAAAQDGQRY